MKHQVWSKSLSCWYKGTHKCDRFLSKFTHTHDKKVNCHLIQRLDERILQNRREDASVYELLLPNRNRQLE